MGRLILFRQTLCREDGCKALCEAVAAKTDSLYTATIYAASKGAVDAFTRGAARELAPGIRVNAIAPGVILTPFHDRYTPADRLEALKSNTPLDIHGETRQISSAVRFLIENEFMTGETIDINGGMFMR